MSLRAFAPLFIFALTLFPALSQAEDIKSFHHKQWQAQCGADYCTLIPRAYPPLALVRGNSGGPWVLSFSADAQVETGRLSIDGAPFTVKPDARMPFPQPLLDGTVLEILYDEEGFSEGVSLAGIKAALLWAEEQQRGDKMARMLVLRQSDWAALEQQATAMTQELCDVPTDFIDDAAGPQRVPGHPELRVLAQICWMAAYNVGSNVYLLGPMIEGLDPVRAAATDEDGAPVIELGLDAVRDQPDQLWSYFKGRGVGDCFTHETWQFNGFSYALANRIYDGDCDGKLIPQMVWPE